MALFRRAAMCDLAVDKSHPGSHDLAFTRSRCSEDRVSNRSAANTVDMIRASSPMSDSSIAIASSGNSIAAVAADLEPLTSRASTAV